jgi:MinD-like ATPase involved in chromosome partitioning or flagellar assembly
VASRDLSAPRIIAFCSFARGAGKTTVLLSLARRLARDWRVAVVDADLLDPGIGPALGLSDLPRESTINHLLDGYEGASPFPAPSIRKGDFLVLPASERLDDLRAAARRGWDAERLLASLDFLGHRDGLEIILVDLPAGLTEEALTVVAAGDGLVAVMRPYQRDYQGIAVLMDVARRLGVTRTCIVANLVPDDVDLASAEAELERVYGPSVVAVPFVPPGISDEGPGWPLSDAMERVATILAPDSRRERPMAAP